MTKRFIIKFKYTDKLFGKDFFFAVAENTEEKALSVFRKEYEDKRVEIKSIKSY